MATVKTCDAHFDKPSTSATWAHGPTRRLEQPHSLSYQETSFTQLSLTEMPAETSTTDELLQLTKSVDTTPLSMYPTMPWAVGLCLDCGDDLAHRCGLQDASGHIHDRHVWRRHAEGHACEFAVQLR